LGVFSAALMSKSAPPNVMTIRLRRGDVAEEEILRFV
jgi:hypothetical protein